MYKSGRNVKDPTIGSRMYQLGQNYQRYGEADGHAFNPRDRWIKLMRRGKFRAAWELIDELGPAIRKSFGWEVPRHQQVVWDGRPLKGNRALVHCYHGLGDTIQFIRYIPLLKGLVEDVWLWVQPTLIELLNTAPWEMELIPLDESVAHTNFGAHLELMELPFFFRTELTTIPCDLPYLFVPASDRPVTQNFAVGLVWRSGDWDDRRSINISDLAPLFGVQNVSFYSLQMNPKDEGWDECMGIDLDASDPLKTAQLIRSLDLLITVDTMAAHLAGALGTPVWTLLQKNADWRWLEDRADSPWYPNMRIFRQEIQGDWAPVIASVCRELLVLISPTVNENRADNGKCGLATS